MGVSQDIESIGHKIANRRMDAGYSQEKFAGMVGISKRALGKIEHGESAPNADTLISICRELHATPNEIMPDDLSAKETGSGEDAIDPEMLRMMEKVKTLSPGKKRRFYEMMNVVFSGIVNPEP